MSSSSPSSNSKKNKDKCEEPKPSNPKSIDKTDDKKQAEKCSSDSAEKQAVAENAPSSDSKKDENKCEEPEPKPSNPKSIEKTDNKNQAEKCSEEKQAVADNAQSSVSKKDKDKCEEPEPKPSNPKSIEKTDDKNKAEKCIADSAEKQAVAENAHSSVSIKDKDKCEESEPKPSNPKSIEKTDDGNQTKKGSVGSAEKQAVDENAPCDHPEDNEKKDGKRPSPKPHPILRHSKECDLILPTARPQDGYQCPANANANAISFATFMATAENLHSQYAPVLSLFVDKVQEKTISSYETLKGIDLGFLRFLKTQKNKMWQKKIKNKYDIPQPLE